MYLWTYNHACFLPKYTVSPPLFTWDRDRRHPGISRNCKSTAVPTFCGRRMSVTDGYSSKPGVLGTSALHHLLRTLKCHRSILSCLSYCDESEKNQRKRETTNKEGNTVIESLQGKVVHVQNEKLPTDKEMLQTTMLVNLFTGTQI